MADFRIDSSCPPTFFVTGELDIATVPFMSSALDQAVAQGGPITLDMSQITFIDSTGVKAILDAARRLASGCLVLHGACEGVHRILDVMGIAHAPNLHMIPCKVPA